MPDKIDFPEIFDSLKNQVAGLAETTLKDSLAEAKKDGEAMIESLKADLKKWTMQLAKKEISKADFEDLVLSQKDLVEMVALKQVGLQLIKAEKFKGAVLSMVVSTVTSSVKS